jgi:Tfp pilus assembly protein PilN
MADIDMIPREYRDGVRLRRLARLTGIALASIVLLGAAVNVGLRWRTAAVERAIVGLQASAAQSQANASRDALLQADGARRLQDDKVRRALRRAGEFAALAQGLDAALSDQVWLAELQVERDVQAAPKAGTTPDPLAPDAGIEEITTTGAAAQVWRLGSRVQMAGQATSYAAVTTFLATLARQPGVANLKLVSSAASPDGGAIDFRAAGTLTPRGPVP